MKRHSGPIQPKAETGQNYDVRFYFLDLNISDSSTYIKGHVTIHVKVNAADRPTDRARHVASSLDRFSQGKPKQVSLSNMTGIY